MTGIGSSSYGSATVSSSGLVVKVYEDGMVVRSGDSDSAFTLVKLIPLLVELWLTSEAVEAIREMIDKEKERW